ncbi:SgcJ/EcaC family oxidoreductase [Actinomadura sp. 1N219]|uniref:SgcJ/EcaC family oxidoreductase n=1 Tax=Actinomadura sp. 1N219 TaxID=3375152 RepID=UPI0037B73868
MADTISTSAVRSYETKISVRQEDAAAILSIVKRLAASWGDSDADTLAKLYADDALVALPGDVFLRGRGEIRDWMAGAFGGKWKGTQVLGVPLELRYLGDGLIVMFSHGGAYKPGAAEVTADDSIRGLWVFAERDGEWTIVAYENTPVRATIPLAQAGR